MTTDERLWKQFNHALGQWQLIDEGDRILVGLSGGKDSLLLTELLARRSRILKPRFSVEALHVRMENVSYETDTEYLEQFCTGLGVPLHTVTTGFDERQGSKPPCFLCSWQRRKQLFNVAQQLGCRKIALGHHQDDVLATALMNLTFQGRFETIEPLLPMRKMPLSIIRPLCLCAESDIRDYAARHGFRQQKALCPHERETNRTRAAQLFAQMEQLNPEARQSLWRAIENCWEKR